MTRTVFAMTAAALLMLAVSGTSQAVPIAPPAGIAADQGNVTLAYWGWHHRHWRGHRHCWRGRWGHVHCRWW